LDARKRPRPSCSLFLIPWLFVFSKDPRVFLIIEEDKRFEKAVGEFSLGYLSA
jgi:hypothetical protein